MFARSNMRPILRAVYVPPRVFQFRRALRIETQKPHRSRTKALAYLGVGSFFLYCLANYTFTLKEVHAETSSKDTTYAREASSQHVQVLNSWKAPGVYIWGNNKGRVVTPDSDADYARYPKRLHFFDNMLLRDLKADNDIGVAVTENGDVLQWGKGYCLGIKQPEETLVGKDIQKVVLSANRVFALSRSGHVYSFPKSKKEQEQYTSQRGSWFSREVKPEISYKKMELPLNYLERVSDISSGLEHLLYLTSDGRLFTSAAAYTYPSRGQMGVSGLNWNTRPKDKSYDTPHEVRVEGNPKIVKIATGDFHSLALDSVGRVWAFGDNTYGQLGFPHNPEFEIRDIPTELYLQGLYPPKGVTSRCTDFAAGGLNSYFMVDAKEDNGKTRADVFACGQGLHGALGNGQWIHAQGRPSKIKSFSGIMQYNGKTNALEPLRVAYIRPSATHVAAVLDTNSNVTDKNEAYFGKDALWWGNNEFYQLGTGKRNNANVPTYIAPLDSFSKLKEGDKYTGLVPQIRLQVTPRAKMNVATGKKVEIEQEVVTGRGVSAIYSKIVS